MLHRAGGKAWKVGKSKHRYRDNWRGVGLADMAAAILSGRNHRASGDMALHVLEIMHAIHISSSTGRHQKLTTSVERPEPLDPSLKEGTFKN